MSEDIEMITALISSTFQSLRDLSSALKVSDSTIFHLQDDTDASMFIYTDDVVMANRLKSLLTQILPMGHNQ